MDSTAEHATASAADAAPPAAAPVTGAGAGGTPPSTCADATDANITATAAATASNTVPLDAIAGMTEHGKRRRSTWQGERERDRESGETVAAWVVGYISRWRAMTRSEAAAPGARGAWRRRRDAWWASPRHVGLEGGAGGATRGGLGAGTRLPTPPLVGSDD